MSQQPFEHLAGTIEHVTFHSDESGVAVHRVISGPLMTHLNETLTIDSIHEIGGNDGS